MIKLDLSSLDDTKNLAIKLAGLLNNGDIITLQGDLGSGKTTFSRFLIKQLLQEDVQVTSPTFNLLNLYHNNNIEIWHFDLYRLSRKEEVYELGIEDAFARAISIIEWPQIITNILPENRIDIIFHFTENEQNRYAIVKPFGPWQQKIINLFQVSTDDKS